MLLTRADCIVAIPRQVPACIAVVSAPAMLIGCGDRLNLKNMSAHDLHAVY